MVQQSDASKVVTGKVRLSYAHIWERYQFPGDTGEPKYSVTLIIPKSDTTTLRKLRAAQQAALTTGKDTKFGGKIPKVWADSIRDGDETDLDDHPELENSWFVAVSSRVQPGVVDQNVNPILDQSEVYSGCYARVSLFAFPYDYAGKKGVSFVLRHIQKVADGDAFGGSSKAEDDFEAVDTEDDADGLI